MNSNQISSNGNGPIAWGLAAGLVFLSCCLLMATILGAAEPQVAASSDSNPVSSEAVDVEGQVASEKKVDSEKKDAADGPGMANLDRAMLAKMTANGLRDLNDVIQWTQMAIDQGLSEEDGLFARKLLSSTLMERATSLMRVINTRSIADSRVQQIRQLVVSDLRRVLSFEKPPAEASYVLGQLMALPGGDSHEARRLLTLYLEYEDLPVEKRADAYDLRARVQTSEEKTLEDFNHAISLIPEQTKYLLARALFHRSRGRLEEALVDVAAILQAMPEDANALILQGEVLRDQGKLDEAIASFDQATVLAPQSPEPFQNRGEIYREKNQFEKAIQEFNQVLVLRPGEWLALVHRAESYLYSEKLQEALVDVELVLEKQPGLIAAHRVRAEVYAKLGRLQEAIDAMVQLAEAVPQQPELKMQLALYYLVNQQLQQAIEAYSDVLEIDPQNFLALRNRGDLFLNLGKHAEAVIDFNKAVDINDTDSLLLNNCAWILATSPYDNVRDGKRAVELATKACTLTRHQKPHILSTLAASYAETGDFESAIDWSQKAVDLASEGVSPEGEPSGEPSGAALGMIEQLAAELANYRLGKPWREDQSERPANESSASPEEDVPTEESSSPEGGADNSTDG